MVHVHSDETATTRKPNALVSYLDLVVSLNLTKEIFWSFIGQVYTVAGLLPISTWDICNEQVDVNERSGIDPAAGSNFVSLCDELPPSTNKNREQLKLRFLHDTMCQVPNSLSTEVGSRLQAGSCDKM